MKSRCVCTILLLTLISISASSGLEWEIEVVDSNDVKMVTTSLVLDSRGYPHICYGRFHYGVPRRGNLTYAYWDGFNWQIEMVDSGKVTAHHASLALDQYDHPHIAHCVFHPHGAIMGYVYLDDIAWRRATFNDQIIEKNQSPSLALDHFNRPHIACVPSSDSDCTSPLHVSWDGVNWQWELIDTLDSVKSGTISLVLGHNGNVHVDYHITTLYGNSVLKYAELEGEVWSIEKIELLPWPPFPWGPPISICLDPGGKPHICYANSADGDLKRARKYDLDWAIDIIDNIGRRGSSNALVVDNYGLDHICYYDATIGDIKCAHWNGVSWQIEILDSTGDVGAFNSMAIDEYGCLHVSYFDATNKFLKYAKSTSVYTCTGIKGDVDNNGMLNVIDVILTIRHLLDVGILDFCGRVRADCDSDGVIAVTDIIGIVNIVLNVNTCPSVGGD